MNALDPPRWRHASAALFASAITCLVVGLIGGLTRLAWLTPPLAARIATAHGPLMTFGFFGTVIGLETAIANRERGLWVMALPLSSAGVGFAAFVSQPVAAALALASGVLFASIRIGARRDFDRRWLAIAASLAWLAAALAFFIERRIAPAVPSFAAFLLFVILDERLETITTTSPRVARRHVVFGALALLLVAAASSEWLPELAARGRGLAVVVAAAWVARHDGPAELRRGGLVGYAAQARFAGYFWLASAGAILLVTGYVEVGPIFDATAHALFLGVAFSMIFAHAPRVVPRLLGIPIWYAPDLTATLALFHAGLALRVGGDLFAASGARSYGGLVTALSLPLFFALIVRRALAKPDFRKDSMSR
ncbi:hypothetical protein BH09MYX1_BH09MYX1_11690 [soil metagenome]